MALIQVVVIVACVVLASVASAATVTFEGPPTECSLLLNSATATRLGDGLAGESAAMQSLQTLLVRSTLSRLRCATSMWGTRRRQRAAGLRPGLARLPLPRHSSMMLD